MRNRLLTAALATSVALSLSPAVANAAPAPVTGVEINTTVDRSVAIDAQFDPNAAVAVGLPALKKLRGEMWDINPPFKPLFSNRNTTLQDIARENGLYTKEQYVNAVRIDNGLTRAAIQRAAEQDASLTLDMHARPDNSGAGSATYNGQSTGGENLATRTTLRTSILDQWGHNEIKGLRATSGAWSGDKRTMNGHLHMLINPANRYFGFGEVSVPGKVSSPYTAARASETAVGGPDMTGGEQRVWLYRHTKAGERPTGLKEGNPGSVSKLNNPEFREGSSKAWNILSITLTVVSVLAAIWRFVQPYLPR